MLSSILLTLTTVSAVASTSCGLRKMENLVTFGDSYTDESRLRYFAEHGGQPPPPGVLLPPNNMTSSGGKAWGRFVAESTGAKYYNYAVSGAMCSDKITSHIFGGTNASFPSVHEYEIPAYQKDVTYKDLYPNRRSDNTVYAMWIGTNDLGIDGFLSDRNVPGTSIPTFVECIWQAFDGIYKTGGRHFVILNQAPLELAPLYAASQQSPKNQLLSSQALCNATETERKMFEYTMSVNTMFDYGVPFQLLVKKRWRGATFTVFNVHDLMLEIHDRPTEYLTAPADVTGSYRTCNSNGCSDSNNSRSSFMW